MAETSKLETIDTAQKAMAVLRGRIDKTRKEEIMAPIFSIDSGEFDDHVLPHGLWPGYEDLESSGL